MSRRRRLTSKQQRRLQRAFKRRAPAGSCLRCFKADATRVGAIEGDMEWLAASLMKTVKFEIDEAIDYVLRTWDSEKEGARFNPSRFGDENRRLMLIQVCRSCANDAHEATGLPFYSMARLEEPGFEFKIMVQP